MRRTLPLLAAALGLAAAAPPPPAVGAIAFDSTDCDQGGHPASFGGGCRPSIFRMNDDGSARKRLTIGASPDDEKVRSELSGDFSPSWSPAGTRIVFSRQTAEGAGVERLFAMNADGTDQRQLVPNSSPDVQGETSPAWSPTRDVVAFEAYGVNSTGIFMSINVVRGDGTGLRALTPPVQGRWANSPVFTADGRHVVYQEDLWDPVDHGLAPHDYAVFMSDLDGSDIRRLTAGDLWTWTSSLAFSPDGHYAAMTLSDGRLYTVRLDGTELTRRTDHVAFDPTWSPVGPALFFSAYADGSGGRPVIERLAIARDGAKPVRVTKGQHSGSDPSWNLAGESLPGLPHDSLPPVSVLGQDVGIKPLPQSSNGPPASRLPFVVVDPSGVRKVETAVGLRTRRGCRFLHGAHLGHTADCAHPLYQAVRGAGTWAKRTGHLPNGRYEVRIRATDRAGHRTRHPRRRVVRLR